MKSAHSSFPLIFLCCILAGSCGRGKALETPEFSHSEANSVYYWRTEFKLDSAERSFLTTHDIEKMYIRFFDVVAEDYYAIGSAYGSKEILPNATIRFIDTIPKTVKRVVPTVFITVDALRALNGEEEESAAKIVQRVLNMVSYHSITGVSEIQLDCDWTRSTDSIYFRLCRAVRMALDKTTETPFTLSSTIRLHQLQQLAPPVDYGVLMCYNTGSFKNPNTKNSILDYDAVLPYLSKKTCYPLHLDVAYPIYDWKLRYRNGEFAGIMKQESEQAADDDTFRHESSQVSSIMRVKQLVDGRLTGHQSGHSVILYHLDSHNIKNYSENEISEIYSRDND